MVLQAKLQNTRTALAKCRAQVAALQSVVARLKRRNLDYRARLAAVPVPGPDNSNQVVVLKLRVKAAQVVMCITSHRHDHPLGASTGADGSTPTRALNV